MAGVVGFCRELAVAEPLAGTGHDEVRRWILLEDCDPWGAKVPRDTQLPAAVREWLTTLDAQPHTRVQLIRRPGIRRDERRKLFVVEAPAEPTERRIVELDMRLDELPACDPGALLARAPTSNSLTSLWLVCTHGSRDRCCAKWGMALWEALRTREGDRVWQSSHLGGHRFAPTLLTLPSNLLWGRVELDELDGMCASLAAGRVSPIARLRGRCAYPPVVQAAECMLRMREGLHADDALRLLGHERLDERTERISFAGPDGRVEVDVELVQSSFATPASCGDEPQPRAYFRLRSA